MIDALTERAQSEAMIQTLEAKNLELRRSVDELRASVHAKDLLLRLPTPVTDPTAVSWRNYQSRQLTDDEIRDSRSVVDE